MTRMKKWRFFREGGNGYQAPETLPLKLSGAVYGHPRFTDGTIIRTSMIVNVLKSDDYLVAITKSGTRYYLFTEDALV